MLLSCSQSLLPAISNFLFYDVNMDVNILPAARICLADKCAASEPVGNSKVQICLFEEDFVLGAHISFCELCSKRKWTRIKTRV